MVNLYYNHLKKRNHIKKTKWHKEHWMINSRTQVYTNFAEPNIWYNKRFERYIQNDTFQMSFSTWKYPVIQRAFPWISLIGYQTLAFILSFFRNISTESNQIGSLKNEQDDPFTEVYQGVDLPREPRGSSIHLIQLLGKILLGIYKK